MAGKKTGIHLLLVGLSIVLYFACLFFESFQIAGVDPKAISPSYEMFQVGWLAVMSGMLAWLANPLLYLSWLFAIVSKDKITLILSISAMLLALSFMLHDKIVVNKTGAVAMIVGYGPGYWLWLGSAISMAIGSVFLLLQNRS